MPYEVRTNGHYKDVVLWLRENVGDVLWDKPIIEWKGKGWTMNHMGSLINDSNDGNHRYLIRLDDPDLAVICALRWP